MTCLPYECEPNSSFLPEFNSFGHCVQGMLPVLPVDASVGGLQVVPPHLLSLSPIQPKPQSRCGIKPSYSVVMITSPSLSPLSTPP